MNKLYQFSVDCGRMGSLSGTFVADEDSVAGIIGQTVHFGEVLGKHSDVSVDIEAEDITVLTDDQDFINKAIKYGLAGTGYSPFDYINEED